MEFENTDFSTFLDELYVILHPYRLTTIHDRDIYLLNSYSTVENSFLKLNSFINFIMTEKNYKKIPKKYILPHIFYNVQALSVYENEAHSKEILTSNEVLKFVSAKIDNKNQRNECFDKLNENPSENYIVRRTSKDYRIKVYYNNEGGEISNPERHTLRKRGTIIINPIDVVPIVQVQDIFRKKRNDTFDRTHQWLFNMYGVYDVYISKY